MNENSQTTVLEPEVNPFAEHAAQVAAKPKKAGILSQVTVRKRKRPIFGVLCGRPGIGKSTFGGQPIYSTPSS
jgi:hypothetical protein